MAATKIVLQKTLQRISITLAVLAISMAGLVITGWLFDVYALRAAFGTRGTMKINTGLSILAVSTGMIALSFKKITVTRSLACLVFAISQLTILEYALNLDFGIDQFLFRDVDADQQQEPPGRMSLLTACNLLVLAIALLAFTIKQYSVAQLLTAFMFILVYASFLGHLFSISQFYQFGRFSTIPSHTAFTLIILNLSILLYCSDYGWMKIFSSPFKGGELARVSFGYFLLTVPAFMAFYLYGINNWQFTPASSLVSSFLVICLITMPVAYVFLKRLDNLDAALQQANQSLQNTNLNLATRNQELTSMNQGLDDIVYMSSHDLKGPITNLEGIFKELQRVGGHYLPPEDLELIQLGANSVTNLQKTIQDLTQIIRSQQMQPEKREPVLLAPLLAEIQQELALQIASLGARLHLQLQTQEIFFSRIHLRSVLINLISNALKYHAPGRVPEIIFRSELVTGGVQLKITDNGLGLSEEQQSKLFTLFKRFHSHVEGSGIGLYIVKRTLDNYGGRIAVSSQVDVGTCFTIFLPQSA